MSAQTKPKKALTNRDIFWACFNWMGFLHGLYNWQRLQGVGFAHAMKPRRCRGWSMPSTFSS